MSTIEHVILLCPSLSSSSAFPIKPSRIVLALLVLRSHRGDMKQTDADADREETLFGNSHELSKQNSEVFHNSSLMPR